MLVYLHHSTHHGKCRGYTQSIISPSPTFCARMVWCCFLKGFVKAHHIHLEFPSSFRRDLALTTISDMDYIGFVCYGSSGVGYQVIGRMYISLSGHSGEIILFPVMFT